MVVILKFIIYLIIPLQVLLNLVDLKHNIK